MYLCYDLKGIQSFIFKVPRLKYIVGGSALVDRFDRVTAKELAKQNGWERIASGGGKGVFRLDEASAQRAMKLLIEDAHEIGADICFGLDDDFMEASQAASQLYPYLPEPSELDGHPCRESGLYPTKGKEAHEVIQRRDWSKGKHIARYFEVELKEALDGVAPAVFVRNADEGLPGHRALGSRNRWAVICMDGNDMGSQFRAMKKEAVDDEQMARWLRTMSSELDGCSRTACIAGIRRVLEEWLQDPEVKRRREQGAFDDDEDNLVVPIRPLVVGGDDITVLCHAKYAASFVLEASKTFTDESEVRAEKVQKTGFSLWPGTNGTLTISAGILYCGTTMPLASAIPYAESLLANAKGKGRGLHKQRTEAKGKGPVGPAPACVDFEAVTESLLDHPRGRRAREVVFRDGDLDDLWVELHRRPYAMSEFEALAAELREPKVLEGVANSILHQLLPGLRRSYFDRQVFYARLGKNHPTLSRALREAEVQEGRVKPPPKGSHWRLEQGVRPGSSTPIPILTTDLLDLVTLAQEGRRMERSTT